MMSSPVRISAIGMSFFSVFDLRVLRTTVTSLAAGTVSTERIDFERSAVRRDSSLPKSSRIVPPQATSKKIAPSISCADHTPANNTKWVCHPTLPAEVKINVQAEYR